MTPTPGSPTSRLLLEYEMHLRNTLAKGMDAESYSLHTFEALLSQSMENLGKSPDARHAQSVCSLLMGSSARPPHTEPLLPNYRISLFSVPSLIMATNRASFD